MYWKDYWSKGIWKDYWRTNIFLHTPYVQSFGLGKLFLNIHYFTSFYKATRTKHQQNIGSCQEKKRWSKQKSDKRNYNKLMKMLREM